jgi:hypothetical protein
MFAILAQLLKLLNIKEGDINPDSPGAKRWIWLSDGQIKISARVFAVFAMPVSLVLLLGFGLIFQFFLGSHEWYNYLAMALVLAIILLFLIPILYNRLARLRKKKNTTTE